MEDYSPREMAGILGVHQSTVYRHIRSGEYRSHRERGRLRVNLPVEAHLLSLRPEQRKIVDHNHALLAQLKANREALSREGAALFKTRQETARLRNVAIFEQRNRRSK